jgi:DNA-binding response OmpR family regulator
MDTRNGSGSEKISPSLQLQLVTPKAILLVEDDPVVARLTISYILAMKLGYQIDWATGCRQALETFDPNKYFVVILDLHLDGSIDNGIRLAIELRNLDDNVFIAVVTGYYPVFERRLVETVDDLLQKPVDMRCLQSKLFMWAIKYRRRISLKNYVDDKVTSSYMQQISEIRAMEDAIRDRLSDIFNYIQCTEESASERQSDQIGE